MPETATVSEPTESRIIEAAIELVGELGYKGTTTRQIAVKAGVNEVTIFRRFGSKEALVEKAIPYAQEQLRAAFESARSKKSGDIVVDLTNLVLSIMDILGEKRETVVAMMFEAKREPYVLAAASSMVQFILSFIMGFLDDSGPVSPLRKEDKAIIALSLASFVFFRVVVRERLLVKEFTSHNRRQELEDYIRFLLRNPPSQGKYSKGRVVR